MSLKTVKPTAAKIIGYSLLVICVSAFHLALKIKPLAAAGQKEAISESSNQEIQIPQGLATACL